MKGFFRAIDANACSVAARTFRPGLADLLAPTVFLDSEQPVVRVEDQEQPQLVAANVRELSCPSDPRKSLLPHQPVLLPTPMTHA
jgi:hypothetical protein